MMSDAVIAALITGVMSVIGTVITVLLTVKKTNEELRIGQAVIVTKIETLAKDVQKHNHFAERIPVLEEQIKVANHRISDLERGAS